MKRIFITVVLTMAMSLSALAQVEDKTGEKTLEASAQTQEHHALRKLAQEWGDAVKRRDAVALDRILADDFINYDGEGNFGNKAKALAALSRVNLASSTSEIVSIRVYEDAAVVASRGVAKGMFMGQDVTGEYLQIATWIKRAGRWQAVAALWNIIKRGTEK